jgi:hypothetical protein
MATIRRYVLHGITAIMGSYGLCAVKVARRGRWTTGAQIGEQRFSHIIVQLDIGHFCRP